LFARAVKIKRKRTQDKDALGALEMEFEVKFVELKDKLVENFLDRKRKTSQGVMNDLVKKFYQKVKKYTQKMLYAVEDFAHLSKGQWLLMMQQQRMI
jgi:DNA-directed RNA polymerase subunit beta